MKAARPRLIVMVALGSVGVWAVFAGAVNPQWSRWNSIQQRLAIKRKELRRLSREASQRRTAEDSDVVRSLSRLWTNPGAAEHTSYIATTMAKLCKQSGMKLESVQPMAAREEKTCQRHPATVTASGDLASTANLLAGINMLKGALDVERLNIRGGDKQEKVTVEMTIASFSRLRRGESKRWTASTSPLAKTGGG